jgi:Tfp pilus assembly protein PilO
VLATAKGEVAWRDEQGVEERVPVASLPVGSVVDLQALGQEKGVTVEVVSDDPEVIQQVLEKLPRDLRVGGQP